MMKRNPVTRRLLAFALASAMITQNSAMVYADTPPVIEEPEEVNVSAGSSASEDAPEDGAGGGRSEDSSGTDFSGGASEDSSTAGSESSAGASDVEETDDPTIAASEEEEAAGDASSEADSSDAADEASSDASLNIEIKKNSLVGDGAASLEADYYVTGAAQAVDKNDLENYTGEGGLYSGYLTGSASDEQSLFSAFYNDILYERQGGKWYNGHEVIRYGASSQAVYDPQNYEKLTDGNDETVAVAMYNAPAAIGSNDMVFVLDYLPVELSKNYRHSVNYGETVELTGVKLYAWEYEKTGDRFNKVGEKEITSDNYKLFEEDGVTYTNSTFVQNARVTTALEGAVRINSSIVNDVDNYIAIVAMIYDATGGSAETVKSLAKGSQQEIWENDPIWYNLADWYGNDYECSYNNFVDDMYSAASMGTFSLRAYSYYKDKTAGTVTLYRGMRYSSYAYQAATNKFGTYVDVRDVSTAASPIETWEIPASYTDPYDNGTYRVILANEPNYTLNPDDSEGLNCGFLYPALTVNLMIDSGVTFPEDCSYFLNNSYWINNLLSFTVKGDIASVGGNIKNFSHFMTYDLAHTSKKWNSIDVKALDTSGATDMSYMFSDVTIVGSSLASNVDVSHFNTSNVTDFEGMFRNYRVTDMRIIRYYYSHVDVSSWDTTSAVNMSYMFAGMWLNEGSGTGNGILDVSGLDFTSRLKNMRAMFAYNIRLTGEGLVKIILPSTMDTSQVTDMSLMFHADASLTEIVNLDKLNTANVIDMSGMFSACFFDRMFTNKTTYFELKSEYLRPLEERGTSGSWIYDRTYFNINDYYFYDIDYPGPAIESLDLTSFDTRNLIYAYGMFGHMPALTEIKWGDNTTFENVIDATYMFDLPGIEELDLTGRKLNAIKYAHSMLNLDTATELTLGENSLGLSNIASDGRFSMSGPMAIVDLTNVPFGDNINALDANSLYNGSWTIYNAEAGLTRLEELRLPANLPVFAKPAVLRQTFFDSEGNSYDYVYGGNSNALVLTTSASGYELERLEVLARVGDSMTEYRNPESIAVALDDTHVSYLDNADRVYNFSLEAIPYALGMGEMKALTPAPDIRWEISDSSILEISYSTSSINTNDEIMFRAKKVGTAKVTVTVNDTLSHSIDVTILGNTTTITSADGSKYTGVKLPDNTYMITGYTSLAEGNTLDLSKDMSVGGSTVTISRIGEYAFSGFDRSGTGVYPVIREGITSIKLPATLKTICYGAFEQLEKVSSVDIPAGSSLEDIGDYAFSELGSSYDRSSDPDAVTTINLQNATGLKRIGCSAFYGVAYLKTITMPEGVSYLGDYAFKGCSRLAQVTLPIGLTVFPAELFAGAGEGATSYKDDNTDLVITNLNDALATVTYIGENAFEIPGGLDNVDVSAPALLSLGNAAFAGTDITGFSAPILTAMGVTKMAGNDYGNAFQNCTKLVTASIPSVKEVSYYTFTGCTSLTTVDISSAVVIGNGAFSGTSSLHDLTLREGVTTIGDNTFSECGASKIILPESLRTIGKSAFYRSSITSLVIPDGVTEIGESVCFDCNNLVTVTIGDGITTIPNYAFAGGYDDDAWDWKNRNLKDIHFGRNITSIGKGAFRGVTFEGGISLPGSLKTIGEDAFNDSYYGSIPASGHDVHEGSISSVELPYGLETIPNNTTGGGYAFRGKNGYSYIEELYLPYTITDISGLSISGLFMLSDEQFEYDDGYGGMTYNYKYAGKIYYPGTRQELYEVIFGENDSTFNSNSFKFGPQEQYTIFDLIDVEYGTGFREIDGKLVFLKKGEPVKADQGKELIRKIGDFYYLIDENGTYLTDRTYIGSEMVDENLTWFIYYFDAEGRGERKEITAADMLAGSKVYSFAGGTVHGAMMVSGGKPVTVAGESAVPAASPSTLTEIGSWKYFGLKNGVLAKGYYAGESNDGFYFDDYRVGDGRLLWYADFSTDMYYTDETKATLLGGDEGVQLKDERGVLVTFRNGKMITLTDENLSITSVPAFSSGTTLALFTGNGSGEASETNPSKGVFTVTVDDSKGTDLTGAGIKWTVSSSFPMVAGTRVVSLAGETELSDRTSSVTIKALAAGTAKIRATLTDSEGNTFFKEATVTVKDLDPMPEGITLSASSTEPIPYNGTVTITATLLPINTTFKAGYDKITWATEDASGQHAYATITDNGNGTATLTGKWYYWQGRPETQKVTVIASTKNGKTARMNFTVTAKNGTTPEDPEVRPGSVTITCEDAAKIVYVGRTYGLTAAVLPIGAPQDVTWSSSDTSVATVNNGIVTGLKNGTVTITAASTMYPDIKSRVNLTVRTKVTSITLSADSHKLQTGRKLKITATFNEGVDKAEKGIKWISSDATIATVDQSGVVTAKSAASDSANAVEITAISLADGEVKSAPYPITVYDPITALKFSSNKFSLGTGESIELKMNVSPITASCENVEFIPSDGGIVSCEVLSRDSHISNVITIKITALDKLGKATITAQATDGSGKKVVCNLTIGQKVSAYEITTPKNVETLAKGKTMKLGVLFNGGVKAEQPVNKAIEWSVVSGKDISGTAITPDKLSSVATIDAKGTLKALGAGTVTVQAKHTAGELPAVTREIRLYVPNSKLTLSEKKLTIKEGRNDYRVTATVTDGATFYDGTGTHLAENLVTWEVTKSDPGLDGEAIVKCSADAGKECVLSIGTLPEGKTKAVATLKATAVSEGNNGSVVTKTATCTITVTKGVSASKVILSRSKISAGVNSTYELTAAVSPASADDREIIFTCTEDSDIVSTEDHYDGTATIKVRGIPDNSKKQAIVTATNPATGKTATCTITVGNAVSGVQITATDAQKRLIVGKNTTLKAKVLCADTSPKAKAANTEVTWSITAAKAADGTALTGDMFATVATIDPKKGKVTAKGYGTVTVTATSTETDTSSGESQSDSQDIVIYKPVTKLTISAGKRTIGEGKTGMLWISQVNPSETLDPSDPDQTIHWKSSDPSVISIAADGADPAFSAEADTTRGQKLKFKAGTPGKKAVVITGTATDGSKKTVKCTITVLGEMKEADVGIHITSKSAKVIKDKITVTPGYDTKSTNLIVTGFPVKKTLTLTPDVTSTAADKKVVYSSDKPAVATVNAKGVITAKSSGTAIITMMTEDGGYSATCTVTIP